MTDSAAPRFDTLAIHAGQSPDPTTGSRAVPIHQTVAYNFRDTKHASDLFALKEFDNIYSRIMNPTNDVLEQRIAALEGGTAALATASGHSAEIIALLNIVETGDSIVSSTSLYAGTWNIFLHTFRKLGIEVRFVETTDTEGFAAASDKTTKAWYVETIGNPSLDVPDLAGLADAGRALGIPLVVDNTFATPYLCRPIEHGAAVIVQSLTKWIGGHGTSIGGVLVDGGNFDWGTGRHPGLSEPDPSYHGLNYWDVFADFPGLGNVAFAIKARVQLQRDLGASLAPFNAQQFILGVETLGLRVQRHSDNALAVARYLVDHPKVAWVTYPGLDDHPTRANADRYLRNGYGGVVAFGVNGGLESGSKLIESVELFSHLANVGDAKSLIIHPASTTHSQLSADELERAGIGEDFVRLSVGIEDIEDIIADLDQALERA
ncbi:MAG: O-acetylhomoserine aminocarboxypropyltransferase/cysteine synthase [Actinomycetota bacterium]|jgi:O-acetylhomoserine (thiol)-lyase|nr:O-acetylhomoserine aminocarboxypropyltransferase/cysteine synthase [Actinomycetota bacterium]